MMYFLSGAVTLFTGDRKQFYSGCYLVSYSNGYSVVQPTNTSFRVWGHESSGHHEE
jgi:hypothetical protein